MMSHFRVWPVVQIAAAFALVVACGDLNVTAVDVAEIEILPDTTSLPVGLTRKLDVRLRDPAGNVLRDRTVSWSSSDPALVAAEADGRITGIAPGTATVYARSGGTSGAARVQVVPAGRLVASPERVVLSAFAGSTVPAGQTVAVSNGGSGQLTGLSTAITYAAGDPDGWLVATLQGTAAPAQLVVSASAGSLAAGTYRATVTVASSTEGVTPLDVPVELEVSVPRPAIELEPSTVSFTGAAGSPDPLPRTVAVRNAGGGLLTELSATVTYAAGQPANWLVATLSAVSAPSTLTLAVRASGLAAGTYNATVLVESPVASNTPRAIAVSLTLSEALPAIGLSETSQLFTAVAGGADPSGHAISVNNQGGGTLNQLAANVTYGVSQPEGWLTVTLSSSTAPATLLLQARTGTRAAGTYTARVEVSSGVASNSPRLIDVTFQISSPGTPPAIGISRSNVTFAASQGGANPPAENIQVTNSGGGTLSGLSTIVKYAAGQTTGWLTAALGSATAPTQLTLQAATGSLDAGIYDATVEVHSAGASNSPRLVTVSFVVKPLTPPAAPTDLDAVATGQVRIDVTWTDNSDNESSFELQRSNFLGLTYTTIATLPAGTTWHQDGDLQRNSTYWYRVRACNSAGCSAWSNADSARAVN